MRNRSWLPARAAAGSGATFGSSSLGSAPWMLWAPTIALAVVVFAVNMFGDAVRDLLDPRLRGAR